MPMYKAGFIVLFALSLSTCGATAPTGSTAEQPDVADVPTTISTETQSTEQPEAEPTAVAAEVPTDMPSTETTDIELPAPTDENSAGEATAESDEAELPPNAQIVPLRYLADLSNFGPQDATGTLTLLPDTNTIIVEVEGLPPVEGKIYEVWMLPAADPGGRFNTDADGIGWLEQTLAQDLNNYDQIILTVEPEPDDSPAPAPEHSIGSDPF
ncbi:MAG: hypothetical protein GFH27_549279n471 [Chloroflexi bacterium AL-W]|nr:hypothetical protein [Chloroflexi bacterium AL-N1]NOK65436.1 hypothetical protein [Chloroflexi bacterium AL-N10]NOK72298.1 hypothetical protein [Chloroflexi bacterium AL-N5]NOK79616.1 hypothetical protein [Chloroflexi bacterium AL-W]NOK87531.1 hypothetical protein [Chloroflexi bacterium AL-N15]